MLLLKEIVHSELLNSTAEDVKQSKNRKDLKQRIITSISKIFPDNPEWEETEPIKKVLSEEFVFSE
jgi:flagellar basal body-associated protein FliL|tara:strand:+ start:584 stop:781 length:198 start_codon:yes stop_codon:yes gene_type:complete